MTDKTKTVVVIERHEQTIIRRSRRMVSGQVMEDGAVAQPLGRASVVLSEVMPVSPELSAHRNHRWLGQWLRTIARKSATVFASRRRNVSSTEPRTKQL